MNLVRYNFMTYGIHLAFIDITSSVHVLSANGYQGSKEQYHETDKESAATTGEEHGVQIEMPAPFLLVGHSIV